VKKVVGQRASEGLLHLGVESFDLAVGLLGLSASSSRDPLAASAACHNHVEREPES